jgi:glycyl-tRNA synthetase beta chain
VALYDALARIGPEVAVALGRDNYTAALTTLASLRGAVDDFFEGVLVNSPVPAERDNRLRLLGEVRSAMGQVADFSLVSG